MDCEKILLALEERERWKERESNLQKEIKCSSKEEKKAKQKELLRIREQVAYYDALTKDMKKSIKPSGVSHLMNALLNL
jgi:hypothetical protein